VYVFAAFVIGYVMGRMRLSFTVSLYKLIILLVILFVLQIIMVILGRKYFKKKTRNRRKMCGAPQEYYDRLYGTESW
jgi:UDP-N-acetylmuramyl pentapeptide phosphotransferase/UDP-N-acetylglucosamine-1-phosphate transferase